MSDSTLLNEIRSAIEAVDHDRARDLLREALKNPTAEKYYLASLVALNEQQRQSFMNKALELDPKIGAEKQTAAPQQQKSSPISNQSTQQSSDQEEFLCGKWRDLYVGKYNTGFSMFFEFLSDGSYLVEVFITNKNQNVGGDKGRWQFSSSNKQLFLSSEKGIERIYKIKIHNPRKLRLKLKKSSEKSEKQNFLLEKI